jgi:hypothetical protein
MALISEWMQQCGEKVLDNAGIVREACSRQLTLFELKMAACHLIENRSRRDSH